MIEKQGLHAAALVLGWYLSLFSKIQNLYSQNRYEIKELVTWPSLHLLTVLIFIFKSKLFKSNGYMKKFLLVDVEVLSRWFSM